MLHFYGAPMSSAGRTHWMLEEVAVPYEYHRVDIRNDVARTAFLQVNPGGKIPFLIDGDVRLAESAAINVYLADAYKPDLVPGDTAGRAYALQWSFWALTNLQPDALAVMHAMIGTAKHSPEEIQAAKARCQRLMDHLDSQLSAKYLVRGMFSVADVNVGSVVNLTLRVNAATAGANTTTWIDTLRARPAYQRAVAGA